MTDKPKYFDIRQDFWQKWWDKALLYEDYLQTEEAKYKDKWDDVYARISLTDSQKVILRGLVRPLRILLMSGIWCGDCSRQGPIIQKISEANDGIEVRCIDNRSNPDLQDELRINGAMKVPVAVFLSEDFFELARFGDRHLNVYRHKMISETGAACATGLGVSDDLIAADTADWTDLIERAHAIVRLAPKYREKYKD